MHHKWQAECTAFVSLWLTQWDHEDQCSAKNLSYVIFKMWHQVWFQNTFHLKWNCAVVQGEAIALRVLGGEHEKITEE